MKMNAISYTAARANLAETIDKVCQDCHRSLKMHHLRSVENAPPLDG
jgi:hypothetical protein